MPTSIPQDDQPTPTAPDATPPEPKSPEAMPAEGKSDGDLVGEVIAADEVAIAAATSMIIGV